MKILLFIVMLISSLMVGCNKDNVVPVPYEEIINPDVVSINDSGVSTQVIPKNVTCFDASYPIYYGEINKSCYLLGCKQWCEERMDGCARIFDGLDSYCFADYVDCLVNYCLNRIYDKFNLYDNAHNWKCIINETKEIINKTRCYDE